MTSNVGRGGSEMLAGSKELSKRLDDLESRIDKGLDENDIAIASILAAIRKLAGSPASPARPIGFVIPKNRHD